MVLYPSQNGYHYTIKERKNQGGCEERGTIGGSDNRHSHNGNPCEDYSEMGTEFPYTLTIYFTLGIYPKDVSYY